MELEQLIDTQVYLSKLAEYKVVVFNFYRKKTYKLNQKTYRFKKRIY